MIKIIKVSLIVIAVISGLILAILFFQDRTQKLEDRKYKEITKISIDTDTADINFYKSEDEFVRVVVYGTSKDTVKLIEGTKYINISKETISKICLLNCKNEINVYIPDNIELIDIKTEIGNINSEVSINNISIDSEKGNINIDKVNILDINSEIGNININELNATNNSSIKTNIGNVNINTISNLKLNTKSDTGSVVIPVIKEEQEFTLNIETIVGNINIDHHENKSE